jgi:hypothetical protein
MHDVSWVNTGNGPLRWTRGSAVGRRSPSVRTIAITPTRIVRIAVGFVAPAEVEKGPPEFSYSF